MTIVSFKKVLKNIYKHFHNICLYQLTEFFKLVEHFKKVNFCVPYDIFNFLGILYNCVNVVWMSERHQWNLPSPS